MFVAGRGITEVAQIPGGHCLGELLAGERSECAVWRGQDVWSGQGRAQGLSGVLH